MALILNIDTAVQSASVCLSDGEDFIGERINPSERESAAWLHVATHGLLKEHKISLDQLQAIAISAGPGSYTGLRVGMAAAKGLCYALQVPLITINTLQIMAASVEQPTAQLLCPMIDARRMEVFTALYDREFNEVMASTNLILDEVSFFDWLQNNTICFFGNGSEKAKPVIQHPHASFLSVKTTAKNMAEFSAKKFAQGQFSDLAYTEPFYGKDFHSSISKKNY